MSGGLEREAPDVGAALRATIDGHLAPAPETSQPSAYSASTMTSNRSPSSREACAAYDAVHPLRCEPFERGGAGRLRRHAVDHERERGAVPGELEVVAARVRVDPHDLDRDGAHRPELGPPHTQPRGRARSIEPSSAAASGPGRTAGPALDENAPSASTTNSPRRRGPGSVHRRDGIPLALARDARDARREPVPARIERHQEVTRRLRPARRARRGRAPRRAAARGLRF